MSSVWVCVPSARPAPEVRKWSEAWRSMGYKVIIYRNNWDGDFGVDAVICGVDPYIGYAKATNDLIERIFDPSFGFDQDARWVVIGGDDVWPDTTKRADEIAAECEQHFVGHWARITKQCGREVGLEVSPDAAFAAGEASATFGVMQPTGDPWASTPRLGRDIERICGSAWIGREFALRSYGGRGPLYQGGEPCWNCTRTGPASQGPKCAICCDTGVAIGYHHMFEDEELQNVAIKLGCFWQRPDLTQLHQHWCRGDNRTREEHMPAFLAEANSKEHWAKYKAIFEGRKAAGFPGHQVKP